MSHSWRRSRATICMAAVLAVVALGGCGTGARANQTTSSSVQSPGPGLRNMILTTDPAELKFAADADFPAVYGVLVDWPLDSGTATIVALRDGTASLYTTSSFGIIGGGGNEGAHDAAIACVRLADGLAGACRPVTDYPYPPAGTVYYYLLTYSGVKRCSAGMAALEDGSDPTSPLFDAAQRVLTQLRLIYEAQDPTSTSR